jgi:hypothetical protein
LFGKVREFDEITVPVRRGGGGERSRGGFRYCVKSGGVSEEAHRKIDFNKKPDPAIITKSVN